MLDKTLLGKRISEYRKNAGLTQEQLAEQIARSTVHISHVEKGRVALSMDSFLDLCRALNVSPNDLLRDQFPPSTPGFDEDLIPEDQMLLASIAQTMRDSRRGYRSMPPK